MGEVFTVRLGRPPPQLPSTLSAMALPRDIPRVITRGLEEVDAKTTLPLPRDDSDRRRRDDAEPRPEEGRVAEGEAVAEYGEPPPRCSSDGDTSSDYSSAHQS